MKPIEITTGTNGYPSHLHRGYVGFGSFEEAESFASKYDGTVVVLKRRDGWRFYESHGWASGVFELSEDNFGDDYRLLYSVEQWDEECREFLSGFIFDAESLKDLAGAVNEMVEVNEHLERLEEGEAVLLYEGRFQEVIKTRTLSYRHDVWEFTIGVEIDGYNDEADGECD